MLAAWRFLVPIPQRESYLSSDVGNSSRAAVQVELLFDLGYRAVMSLELGKALCGHDALLPQSESFSVLRSSAGVDKQQLAPAIHITTLLVMGLRRIRAEFAKRVQASRAVAVVAYCPFVPIPPPDPAVGPSPFARWLSTPGGQACVRELRWLLPTDSVVESRLRHEPGGVRVLSSAHLLALQACGAPPLWQQGLPAWGPQFCAWEDARAVLHTVLAVRVPRCCLAPRLPSVTAVVVQR